MARKLKTWKMREKQCRTGIWRETLKNVENKKGKL
jgi:hypothetical protein